MKYELTDAERITLERLVDTPNEISAVLDFDDDWENQPIAMEDEDCWTIFFNGNGDDQYAVFGREETVKILKSLNDKGLIDTLIGQGNFKYLQWIRIYEDNFNNIKEFFKEYYGH